MTFLEAVISGILQGIAEFLPISSSGHLALATRFFGGGDHGFAFDVALHLATLFSVIIVYRKDVLLLFKGFFKTVRDFFKFKRFTHEDDEKLFICVFLSALPLGVSKLFSLDEAAEKISGSVIAVGILLIINGIILFLSDRIARGRKTLSDNCGMICLGVGMIQATFGILPGISRSGSTIASGRFLGLTREEAVRFSFLTSLPAVAGACMVKLPDFFKYEINAEELLPILCGMFAAAATGLIAIKILKYLSEKSYFPFAAYCVTIGAAVLIFEAAHS